MGRFDDLVAKNSSASESIFSQGQFQKHLDNDAVFELVMQATPQPIETVSRGKEEVTMESCHQGTDTRITTFYKCGICWDYDHCDESGSYGSRNDNRYSVGIFTFDEAKGTFETQWMRTFFQSTANSTEYTTGVTITNESVACADRATWKVEHTTGY